MINDQTFKLKNWKKLRWFGKRINERIILNGETVSEICKDG